MIEGDYDVVVVGAGVAGTAAAFELSKQGRRVALVERDWREPNRIVGELLQPGGVQALETLGLSECLGDMDAIDVHGYAVFKDTSQVPLEYPNGKRGYSFHHGKFINNLRQKVKSTNVSCIEATVVDLIKCVSSEQYIGVKVKSNSDKTIYNIFADLVIVADGCRSNFRKQFIPTTPKANSQFVGFILKDCDLPYTYHGHVILAKPSPILLYQIGTHDTRILVDIPHGFNESLGMDKMEYMKTWIGPQLPQSIQPSFYKALETEKLRGMDCSWLPGGNNIHRGLVLVGDAQNMRHPLTGGGMTVAFWDVIHLTNLLSPLDDLSDVGKVSTQLAQFSRKRKTLSSVINILANALYGLFSANDDADLMELQNACFEYFLLGGRCASTPVKLLAGILPQPATLIGHFFAVAVYSMFLITFRGPVYLIPWNFVRSFFVLSKACDILFPLLWAEVY
ncbi:squalene epoxidase-domain-containing protein [Globomyces pollinis-pini]|nr:squalene epoxidase-domain-containing protein [Globomyces pollinis-pini]